MIVLLFILFGLADLSYAIPVKLENCLPWVGHLNITAVRIPNCEAEPCLMRITESLDVEIDFVPSITLDSVQAQSSVMYFGNYFQVTLMPFTELCNTPAARFRCPIEANRTYTFNAKLLVGVDPGESTKLPGTWSVDIRTSGIKASSVEITDCSIKLLINH